MVTRSALILFFLYPLMAIACQAEWLKFVGNPTAATHETLDKEITNCRVLSNDQCARPSSQVVKKLVGLVEANNSLAIDIAFSSLTILDGGDLEDVIRALGLLSESNPAMFLGYVKKHRLSAYQLRRLLVMLPLNAVDNLDTKIDRVQKRIDSLSTISHPPLNDVRDKSVQVLQQYLTQLHQLAR